MERALLLFEDKFPCWDEETFALVGENILSLRSLEKAGYLKRAGGGYVLTKDGNVRRQICAEECGLAPVQIGKFDAEEALWNNRLYLLMERAFVGQFGIKEYSTAEELRFTPRLERERLWDRSSDGLRYLWPDDPMIRSFIAAFPKWGVGARGVKAPGAAGLAKWASENGAAEDSITFNLILRSRYDFALYRGAAILPDDIFRIKDADRLFFLRAEPDNLDTLCDQIGKLHLFMLNQRRVYVPGYADIDEHEQENWTMIVLVTEKEKQLEELRAALSPDAKALISPANPLFVIGTSFERLRWQQEPEKTVYDWFCDRTVHIARPDVD